MAGSVQQQTFYRGHFIGDVGPASELLHIGLWKPFFHCCDELPSAIYTNANTAVCRGFMYIAYSPKQEVKLPAIEKFPSVFVTEVPRNHVFISQRVHISTKITSKLKLEQPEYGQILLQHPTLGSIFNSYFLYTVQKTFLLCVVHEFILDVTQFSGIHK